MHVDSMPWVLKFSLALLLRFDLIPLDVLHDNILNIVYRITALCELKRFCCKETTYYFSHNTHGRMCIATLRLKFESISRVRRTLFKNLCLSFVPWIIPIMWARLCCLTFRPTIASIFLFHFLGLHFVDSLWILLWFAATLKTAPTYSTKQWKWI